MKSNEVTMGSGNWLFARAFLHQPRVVASVLPSSRILERRIIKAANIVDARVVVEFGGGTGGTTRAMLRALPPDGRLIVIERTAAFIGGLQRIGDPRLEVVHGCASQVGAELAQRGLAGADAIVSGIPFSTLPPAVARNIAAAVRDSLVPGGRFIAYQFTDRVADYLSPLLGEPLVQHEFWNVPPVRVFTWSR
jgi:phosphatidylethanolamine/phosphatidyl-N-methylethanolamine N-methyltransferase